MSTVKNLTKKKVAYLAVFVEHIDGHLPYTKRT